MNDDVIVDEPERETITSTLRFFPQTSLCLEESEVESMKEGKGGETWLHKDRHSLAGGSSARHSDWKREKSGNIWETQGTLLSGFGDAAAKNLEYLEEDLVTVKMVGSGSLSGLLRWNENQTLVKITMLQLWTCHKIVYKGDDVSIVNLAAFSASAWAFR